MKRKVLALTFLFISAYTFAPAALSAQSEIGIIRQMNGTVEIKTANSDIYTAAKAGDRIAQDTVISTGFRSNAIIEIGSSHIMVRPLTHLTLTQLQIMENEETVNLNLQTGRVRVDVKPPSGTKSTLSVQSPSSVASVRGTSFEFDTRNLYVTEGSVSFMGNRGQEIKVNAGMSSQVGENSKVVSPIEIKTSSIHPEAPVGSTTAGTTSAPVRVGVTYTLLLDWDDN